MGNVHMEATQINYRGGSKKMSVEEAIKAAGTEITPEEKTWIDSIPALTSSNAGKTDQDVIAPEFDAEAGVYAVGDKVMYDGKLYKFTTAHETPGDWNITEVSETTVDDELSSLESGLTNVSEDVISKHGWLTSNKWYKIAEKTIATPVYYIRHICLSVAGTGIKHVQLRCVPTDGFNNNDNIIEQYAGTQQSVALKVSTDGKTVEIFIKGTGTGGARYTVLSEGGESGVMTYTDPVETAYTTEDMTVVN